MRWECLYMIREGVRLECDEEVDSTKVQRVAQPTLVEWSLAYEKNATEENWPWRLYVGREKQLCTSAHQRAVPNCS